MKKVFLSILIALGIIGGGRAFIGQAVPEDIIPSQVDFSDATPYRNDTILVVKPSCVNPTPESNHCSRGDVYQAGDIINILDGEDLYQRFGSNKVWVGESEKTEYLYLIIKNFRYDDVTKRSLITPETDRAGNILRLRSSGVVLQNFLSAQELSVVAEGRGLQEIKEVQRSNIQTKAIGESSKVELPVSIRLQKLVKQEFKRLSKIFVPIVYAQTPVTKTIDPDNGTCNGGAADYTSMSLWEAQNLDLVSLNQIQNVRICSTGGTADTTAVVISGWTTSATQYIDMEVLADYRHDGKWNTSKYRLSVANNVAFDTRAAYIYIDGIQMEVSSANAGGQGTFNMQTVPPTSNRFEMTNSIVRTHANSSFAATAFQSGDVDQNYYIKNVVIQDRTGNGSSRGMSMESTVGYPYNLTIKSASGTGVRNFSGTMNIKNSTVSASTCFLQSGGSILPNYSFSTDATADDWGGTGNQINKSEAGMNFVSVANTDFHITSGSSLLLQATDLSADANFAFSDDIDYNTRTGTWDVGVDQFSTASASAPARFIIPTGGGSVIINATMIIN